MRTALLLLLATSACRLPELTMPRRFIDLDGDGYTEAEGDCEPLNGEIYPGADEYCDNLDNNCNVSIDEEGAIDESTWYQDQDHDSYGDPNVTLGACNQPAGFVSNDDDCDDLHGSVAPGNFDDCDRVDSDCDGVADDDADVVWYRDEDLDGATPTSVPPPRSSATRTTTTATAPRTTGPSTPLLGAWTTTATPMAPPSRPRAPACSQRRGTTSPTARTVTTATPGSAAPRTAAFPRVGCSRTWARAPTRSCRGVAPRRSAGRWRRRTSMATTTTTCSSGTSTTAWGSWRWSGGPLAAAPGPSSFRTRRTSPSRWTWMRRRSTAPPSRSSQTSTTTT
ncbi:MAG: putative metal-binding motif-containing protein [Deltaproteobacteria bacterium]|nr:putative metal-binding motif-containing protein [Deltaproteobacteria bacterium]